jgi:hypothetical protein
MTTATLTLPATARAFPSFARAYGVACSTCHSAFPRRNETGDAFRKAGYHMPSASGAHAVGMALEPITMKGNSLFDGYIPAAFPFAAVGTAAASYTNEPSVEPKFAIGSPNLRLLAGAALSEHVSVIAMWSVREPPSQMFVHVARIAGRPELNLLVGRFEQTKTLFRANEALLGDYVTNVSSINGHIVAEPRNGVELNGIIARRGFYALGVVQEDTLGPNVQGYYHASVKLGGLDFLGESDNDDVDLDAPTSVWDGASLTNGHWGSAGRVAEPGEATRADIRRLGLDAKLQVGPLSAWGGVMLGFDREQRLDRDSRAVQGFGELGYSVTAWLLPIYVYQFRDTATERRLYQQHLVGLVFLPLENVRARVLGAILPNNREDEVVELQLMFAI